MNGPNSNCQVGVDFQRQCQDPQQLLCATGTRTDPTGFDGGRLGTLVDVNIHIPSNIIEQVEDLHLVVEHMVVKTLKELAREMVTAEGLRPEVALPEITTANGHQP
jgi:hypothetical protein